MSEGRSYKELVKEYGREMEAAITHHPATEELALYLDGHLKREEEELIAQHLTFCRRCNGKLARLNEPLFLEPQPQGQIRPKKFPKTWWHHLAWGSVAAILLLILFLRPPVDTTEQPQFVAFGTENARDTPLVLVLGADEPGVVLQVPGPTDQGFGAYFLELTHPDGRMRVFDRLQEMPGPRFGLFVTRAQLKAGDYTLVLQGRNLGEQPRVLRRYQFRIEK